MQIYGFESTKRPLWSVTLGALLAACSGSFDDPGPGGNGGPTAGAPGGTTAGSAGTAGVGNTAGTGGIVGMDPAPLDAGRVVLRRLNRTEYDNTMRDLLGTSLRPAEEFNFPPDDISVDGYDTVGLALNFTALHGEQMEAASAALVSELMARPASDPARSRVLVCAITAENADVCTREVLSGFMRRAFRRPVTPAELDDFVSLAAAVRANGGTPQAGLGAALRATLLSPHFLFRVEIDSDPASPAPHRVSDHELATRLSYFLWSSTPDDALLDAADRGAFSADPAELGRQFERLMSDGRSDAVIANLSAQWLMLRSVDEVAPAAGVFPTFDESLRQAMRQETELFFENLVRDSAPIETLLLADYTYADARLARHYGLQNAPAAMARVSLAGTPRVGLLTQTSFLSMTSYPDRTSPVKRGAWVLEQMLCSPPPPAPPDVNTALAAPTPSEGMTLREKLEAHRSKEACAGCHSLFDPIGFGLENFDAIGSYRTMDNGRPVDSSGMLGSKPFQGAAEIATIIASDPRFVPCVIEHFMTYGVGRSFRERDAKHYAEGLAQRVRERGGTWRNVLETIVTSDAFQTRRGGPL